MNTNLINTKETTPGRVTIKLLKTSYKGKAPKKISQRKMTWDLPKVKKTRLTNNFSLETMEVTE